MANEYLKRTPTSTGNRRVWTWSGWIKRARTSLSADQMPMYAGDASTFTGIIWGGDDGDKLVVINYISGTLNGSRESSDILRDPGSWYHILVSCNSTLGAAEERIRLYINGTRILKFSGQSDIGFNINTTINNIVEHNIGRRVSNGSNFLQGEMFDVFLVDGQALTPDVFGFYKVGKGYVSAGSTQSTDFRPGQWVPKTPRVIKTAINNSGGFGVNGFYLPMNDSNNFGADFHCEPNSIIKLQENLPQPRCRIDGVGDYTGALRDDPFKQYLIYAQPNVLGGLQSGYGDYSHIIRGSGSPKTITGGDAGASGTPVISTTQSLYYGSSLYFDGSNDTINVETNDSNYLGRDFTIEFWIWMDSQASQLAFNTTPHPSFAISLNRGGSGQTALFIGNGSSWQLTDFRSGGVLYSQQWNHVAVERYNNAITIYHNGVAQGSYKQGDQVVTNSGTFTGVMPTGFSSLFRYGTYNSISGEPVFGYIQDYRVYSGVAKYTGGFDVPRPYTPVGIATWRAVPDSPANNFATWNAVQNSMSLTDGNLTCTGTDGSQEVYSTIGITTGKWYVEARTNVGTHNHFGVRANSTATYAADYRLIARDDGNVYGDTSQGQVGTLSSGYASAGNIVAMAIDGNLGQITYYVNGANVGGPYSIYQYNSSSLPTPYKIYNLVNSGDSLTVNFGQNPSFSGNTTAGTYTDSNNKGLFKYQPPSGFLALCEDNLPTPAISDPGKHFKTVLWTGDGASGRSIVGVGFQPDFVWIKARDSITGNNILVDSVRGSMKTLFSEHTVAEYTDRGVYSFNADGFTTGPNNGDYSSSGANYVAWCWKAGAGTTSTNTNGSITSVVSVNQDAGFSIVSYTGTGANATVGHGLGKTPSFIIIKDRTSGSNGWPVYHKSTGNTIFLYLNATSESQVNSTAWNNTSPTSNVFTVGTGTLMNTNGNTYIAYCWAEIEGYSKFGSYVGNGSADGPFIYTGGRPAFVMIKRTDSTQNWPIIDSSRDSVNVANRRLFANLTDIEDQGIPNFVDILSNGFKCRDSNVSYNASGGTYIFACWMESPFTTANAK